MAAHRAADGVRRSEAVTGLLEKLRAAKIKEFVSDAGRNPAEAGSTGRRRSRSGWARTRPGAPGRFASAGGADKKGVYAQREGDTVVLLVEESVEIDPASAVALRDKTVFSYDRGKLERVEIESPKGKVALALQDGKWRITAPVTPSPTRAP